MPLILGVSFCSGQEKHKDTLALNIVTKVPFNGKFYFIKITPMESGNRDNMPMFGSQPKAHQKIIYWNDSLQHILPDSILHMLQDENSNKIK